ncbi:hypothetical protein [Piscibacillus salipiscarius]|uniref:Peptide ABC transporter substrate-binding protein n=1 Tax=Piscibacillus salipiscarius TaxID=299480 RepID=A0ABW5QCW3_9BACI|nr:hypothetical protein [Piscibacillus salipiscarius]
MKIIKVLLATSLLVLSGCGTLVQGENSSSVEEAYIVALDELMKTDEALNHGQKFIAINMENFKLNEEKQQKIVNYFSNQYNTKVKIATLEELKEQGHFDEETMSLDGVLLRFEEIDQKFSNKYVFKGHKFKSGLGAIWLTIEVKNNGEEWAVTESRMDAIS